MRKPNHFGSDAGHEHDAEVVARFVALVHARRKGDYLAATAAHQKLQQAGVIVKFKDSRIRKVEKGGVDGR